MKEGYIPLGYPELAVGASLVFVNAALSFVLRLGLERRLLWAASRMTAQLLLVGFVLKWAFESAHPLFGIALLVPMTLIAGISAVRRSARTFPGMYWMSIASIWASTWLVSAFALGLLVRAEPWYSPRNAIPLTGMILGNSLTGVSLAIERFTSELVAKRGEIETMLSLGATRWEAARDGIRQGLRAGMVPMINTMFAAGIVSLPGMMTGQMLAGADAGQAARYQIILMFLLAASTALGTMGVVLLSYLRLFNEDHQFRYDLIARRDGDFM